MIALLFFILILLLIGGGIMGWPLIAVALGLSSATDKPGALKQIKHLMNTHAITPAEVDAFFSAPTTLDEAQGSRSKGDIAKTLFIYLGAIFIVAGIGTYIASFWDTMGGTARVLATLGTGYALLIMLVVALYENRYPRLVVPLTLSSAFMMTSGWYVLLGELYPDSENWREATLFVFGVMAVHQAVLLSKYRSAILAVTSLFFAYGFMHVGLDLLGVKGAYIAVTLGSSLFLVAVALEKTTFRALAEPALLIAACWLNSGLFDRVATYSSVNWASLIIGACVMVTAYGMQKSGRYPRLIAIGYFAGSIMAYAGLFDLVENTSVELLYLGVSAAMLYASVVLESRVLLLTTVIAMLGFIGYYSAEHFANSLGWPITLMVMGVAFLGIGAIALKLKRRI